MERYLYRIDVDYWDEFDECQKQASCFVSAALYVDALTEAIDYFGDSSVTSIACKSIDTSIVVVDPQLADQIEQQL